MTRLLLPALCGIMVTACTATTPADTGITPRPREASVPARTSPFIVTPATTLYVDAPAPDSARVAGEALRLLPGLHSASSAAPNQLRLIITSGFAPEGYSITAGDDATTVQASTGAGLYYGLQSLRQLLSGDTIPAVTITDSPRFDYRGLLLDVSRHFRTKEFVMKQIDAMAALKLNTLHLHLTDAAGWRLQIDRYPLLTELAAWRSGTTWKEWNASGNRYLPQNDPDAQGGFYTKDDIREIVAYAADRYVTVIPEIEMPSHSEEVLAAYPELGCTGKPYTTSDFCPGRESTFEFLEGVLDEVIELFPSTMIHIGGDEAPKTKWHDCPDCQARMKAEGIADVDGLQSYMIHRIERYLNSKGRSMIGWDEIMQGGLSPTATVLSWRGTDGGTEAAAMGNDAVMAPGKYCYFDGYQDAPSTQPEAIGGYLPLEMVYGFDPAPASLPDSVSSHIRGVEATLFTEYIPTAEHAEYMLYPRTIALAEVAWTPQELRDYANFRPRAERYAAHLRRLGYNVFDLATETGNRPEAITPAEHLALGAKVTYNVPWWERYPAAEAATLTDGLHGGWNYNDLRWQGFLSRDHGEVDVTIDLGSEQPVSFVGADFMQICGPDVWLPTSVTISAATEADGPFTELDTVTHEEFRDDAVTFKNYSWSGNTRARYIRYRAVNTHGILFTDEIVVR